MQFAVFSKIFVVKFDCKKDTEWIIGCRIQCSIRIRSSHRANRFRKPQKIRKRNVVLRSPMQLVFFSEIVVLNFHCKKTRNGSLDAEFNALLEYVVLIERIDFENPKKSEKRTLVSIYEWYRTCVFGFWRD